MKTRRKTIITILLLVPLLLVAGFLGWALTASDPLPEAEAALQPDASVRVDRSTWIAFEPIAGSSGVGLVVYPGGRVDARAYAPLARSVAENGYLAVITPMPLNFAFLGSEEASDVRKAYPEIEAWVIAGHSLGGAMAARYAAQNPALVQGLVLWAAYPAASDDLSASELPVASIYGTLDGLATLEEIEASRPLLPPDARWVPLEGGNHAQFGWYGPQSGDNSATMNREDQQAQILAATLALLDEVAQEVDG